MRLFFHSKETIMKTLSIRNKIRKCTIATLSASLIFLTSCVTINHPIIDAPPSFNERHPNIQKWTYKRFIGVPLFLSMEGSSVRYNHEYVLTNKHNSLIFMLQGYREGVDIHYHPDCDIALVRDVIPSSEPIPKLGKVYLDKDIVLSGYPVGVGYRASEGKFIGDVVSADSPNCQMSASDAGVMGGMSGGGVWNTKGELVGVVVGYVIGDVEWERKEKALIYREPSVFISLVVVQEWIDEIVEKGE